MSAPGWYPDPAGIPGRVRYWDGSAWTDRTAVAPAEPTLPGTASPEPTRRPSGRGRSVWIAVLVAVVLSAVLVSYLLTRPADGDTSLGAPTLTASPTISGWDEEPTPGPSPSPTPSPSSDPLARCADDDSGPSIQMGIEDGRLRVGAISMPIPGEGWAGPYPDGRVRYARAGVIYLKEVEATWSNAVMIGATNFTDKTTIRTQAETIVRCLRGSSYFGQVGEKLAAIATTSSKVSGYPAIQVDATFTWKAGKLETTRGSYVRVIVVDHPQQPYFFLSEASIERRDILSEVAEVAAGLRVA